MAGDQSALPPAQRKSIQHGKGQADEQHRQHGQRPRKGNKSQRQKPPGHEIGLLGIPQSVLHLVNGTPYGQDHEQGQAGYDQPQREKPAYDSPDHCTERQSSVKASDWADNTDRGGEAEG